MAMVVCVPSLTPIASHMRDRSTSAVARMAAIAGRQHGVASHSQLIAIGLAPSTIARWVDRGHLHRLHRGVYAVGHPNVSKEGRWLAAVLACGPGAALSGMSAAHCSGLLGFQRFGAIHVSLTDGSKRSPRGIVVHRPRRLEERDVITRAGIPITTPCRTLFDVASLVSARRLRAIFERAEYLDVLDRPRLLELLEGAIGRRGLGELRKLVGFEPIPLHATKSALERIVLSVCRTHGLPVPGVNVPLLDYEVDFFWPEARFVVEADGGLHVGAQRDRDNERDVVLMRAGILVRRYSWEALRSRELVGDEIRQILDERLPARR